MIKFLNKLLEKINVKVVITHDEWLIKENWVALARAYAEKSNRLNPAKKTMLPRRPKEFTSKEIDFIIKMVKSELGEMKRSKTFHDQIDAVVDAIYYLISLSAKNGINLEPFFRAVHRANMRKLVDGLTKFDQKTGKNLKPEGWVPPEEELKNIIEILKLEDSF